MATTEDISKRLDQLIDLSNRTRATIQNGGAVGMMSFPATVSTELFTEFRTAFLSFIFNLYGASHPFYKDFDTGTESAKPSGVSYGQGILKAIKSEVEGGWLVTMKGLISAEIFTDFLEMAEHLLEEKYKDPAAVMIGSVLEEHLRQLCFKKGISIEERKGEKLVSKKADLLNSELSAASIYIRPYTE
jgi:hypothetical protein